MVIAGSTVAARYRAGPRPPGIFQPLATAHQIGSHAMDAVEKLALDKCADVRNNPHVGGKTRMLDTVNLHPRGSGMPKRTAGVPALSRRERQVMDILFQRGEATAAEVMADLPDPP